MIGLGKQHDVSECMDNCMFQIETALLNFGDNSEDDKTSVVKRYITQAVVSYTQSSNLVPVSSMGSNGNVSQPHLKQTRLLGALHTKRRICSPLFLLVLARTDMISMMLLMDTSTMMLSLMDTKPEWRFPLLSRLHYCTYNYR
jgi:hypothetical protein